MAETEERFAVPDGDGELTYTGRDADLAVELAFSVNGKRFTQRVPVGRCRHGDPVNLDNLRVRLVID